MFKKSLFGILVAAQCFAASDNQNIQEKPEKSSQEESINIDAVSEAFGNFLGRTLASPDSGIELNIEKIIDGIRNGAAGKPSPLTDQEYQKSMIQLRQKAFEKKAEENLQEAETFLEKKEKEPEVRVMIKEKLQYQILKGGDGPIVEENATPKIKYTGKFIDGTVFGSSEQTGPISIPLAHTIQGFKKGIAGMHQGEKRRLFIHPELAYGKQGELPPNMLLIFDVEVMEADTVQQENTETSFGEDEDLFEMDE